MRNQTSQHRILARRPNKHPQRVQRRGISIILVGVILIALIGFVSLAVDIGRVRLADAQVKTVADAAARAGAFSLWGNTTGVDASQDVLNEAVSVAADNPNIGAAANGQDGSIALQPASDVHFGSWNSATHTFTTISGSAPKGGQDPRRGANAVRVEAWRNPSRGNAVKLIFGPVIGVNAKNAYASSIAYITGGPDRYAFVGINSVSSNGTKATLNGGVASDGNISLGNGDVNGDARPGMNGGKLTQGPNSVVTGWTASLDFLLSSRYKILPVPGDAIAIPTGTNPQLTGGVDAAHAKDYVGVIPSSMKISGFVRIYVNTGRSVNLTPTITFTNPSSGSLSQNSQRLQIYVTTAAITSYSKNGNAQIDVEVYAPGMDFSIGGTVDFTGWIIAKSLSFKGNSTYTSDVNPNINGITSSAFVVHLVDNMNTIIK